MWSTITTVKEENKALTLIMKMKRKAFDLALNIDETLLKTTEANKAAYPVVGVEFLISKLDEVYLKTVESTSKLEELEAMRKKSDQEMSELIQIFKKM